MLILNNPVPIPGYGDSVSFGISFLSARIPTQTVFTQQMRAMNARNAADKKIFILLNSTERGIGGNESAAF